MNKTVKPFGAWPSPISAEMVAGQSLRFGVLQAAGGTLYWSESRPAEKGRGVILRQRPGEGVEELLPPPYSARSRVHEYGGGEFLVAGETVYFVNDADQDVYVLAPREAPRRLTRESVLRFADMTLDASRRRLVAVAERHPDGDTGERPENLLVAIALDEVPGANVHALARGRDFYAAPRLRPDGGLLAWLAWDLPHMPWEAAELNVAAISATGELDAPRVLAGGGGTCVFQPEWAPDGRLCFVWDDTGWGNLYAWDGGGVEPVLVCEAELGRPLWVFGMCSYGFLDDRQVAVALIEDGETRVVVLDPRDQAVRRLDFPLREASRLVGAGREIAVIGVGDHAAPAVLRLRPADEAVLRVRESAPTRLDEGDVSIGDPHCFDGAGGAPVHGLYYPPTHSAFHGPQGESPPVVVMVHGGPTGSADRGLKLKTQFWSSRGFGVFDVDYSGSWGYGRRYRARLDGTWGVREVADVAAAARHLAEAGLADPERLLITGGSAGGYTVLLALAEDDIFAAGACSYGVSDLAQLQRTTHKFEAGYLYGLVGTTPESADAVFAARSPASRADEIRTPVIFFQGAKDRVVPPQQSRQMVESLRRRRVPVAYLEFAEEGHGFRRADTIERALLSEFAFYAKILELPVVEPLPDVEIANWPRPPA